MRVLAVTAGSWGDILPFVPPVTELARRGHDVVIAVPPIFVRPLRRLGLQAVGAGPFLKRRRLTALHDQVGTDVTGWRPFEHYWNDLVLADAAAIVDDLEAIKDRPDVVLAHQHSVAAHALCARRHLPRSVLAWGPACTPSAGYASPTRLMQLPDLAASLGAGCEVENSASWEAATDLVRDRIDPPTNAVLEGLGVDPVRAAPFTGLPGAGRSLLLTSHSALIDDQPDWADHARQVGYPYFDSVPGTSTQDVDAFMAAGLPPVVISFGTAIAGGATEAYRAVCEGVIASGRRALVLGPAAIEADGDVVATADFVPMDQVASRSCLVVHHGGPGTTLAALRAGVPALAIPQFLDQPLNAAAVAARGAGVAVSPSTLAELDVSALIEAATACRPAAELLGRRIADDPDPAAAIADDVERVAVCGP